MPISNLYQCSVCELNQEYILYFQDIYFSIFACSLMHSLKVSDHSSCIWNARRDTEWCCCTMMLTAGSPCCIQRDFPICAAAGGGVFKTAGGGAFGWHTESEDGTPWWRNCWRQNNLQVVDFSKTAGGKPWWRNCRWWSFQMAHRSCRWLAMLEKLLKA